MNSEEIKAEAKKRLANMTLDEKKAMLGLTKEDEDFLRHVNSVGLGNLTNGELSKFSYYLNKEIRESNVGDAQQVGIEKKVKDEFNITRDDIKNMAPNPYKAKMLKALLITALLNVGSAVLGSVGLGAAIPVLEVGSGIFALGFAQQLMNYFKYKKIQKKYVSGELEEEEIRAEMVSQLWEDRSKGRLL